MKTNDKEQLLLGAFANRSTLEQIGVARVSKLMESFRSEFDSAGICLPSPDNEDYLETIAGLLRNFFELPMRFLSLLMKVEAAAAPGKRSQLDEAITRRIPNVSLSGCCEVDRALELWFQAPEELELFIQNGGGMLQKMEAEEKTEAAPQRETKLTQEEEIASEPQLDTGQSILDRLVAVLNRFVILPEWAADALALWILHTYAFHLRDITAYIGIESPEKRCGKTTLLSVLNELCHRALTASNISPPAFFRVIEEVSPTLLIDEADTFLNGNDQLRGILNAGYNRKMAFVLRASSASVEGAKAEGEKCVGVEAIKRYSCWCPKALAKIGKFPDTLADRCILIRMQRKIVTEPCERLRELDPAPLREECLKFVEKHSREIASGKPAIPAELNDRAADIWEPLLVLADIVGGNWPRAAREAAIALSGSGQESSEVASLLFDIYTLFVTDRKDRMFSSSVASGLSELGSRSWNEKGERVSELWLAKQLRPYGVRPKALRIGDRVQKGYNCADLLEAFKRYVPRGTALRFADK